MFDWWISKFIHPIVLKTINCIVLFFYFVGVPNVIKRESGSVFYSGITNEYYIGILVCIFIGLLIGCIIADERISSIDFFEWDKKERMRKKSVYQMYILLCSLFFILFCVSIWTLFFIHDNMTRDFWFYYEMGNWSLIIINLVSPFFLLLSSIYPDYFYNWAFKENLILPNHLDGNKPDWWVD